MSVVEIRYRCDHPKCGEKITVFGDADFNARHWQRRSIEGVEKYHVCPAHVYVTARVLEGLVATAHKRPPPEIAVALTYPSDVSPGDWFALCK